MFSLSSFIAPKVGTTSYETPCICIFELVPMITEQWGLEEFIANPVRKILNVSLCWFGIF